MGTPKLQQQRIGRLDSYQVVFASLDKFDVLHPYQKMEYWLTTLCDIADQNQLYQVA